MKTALIVIAVCEVIRILQNSLQLITLVRNSTNKYMKTASKAFVESLQRTDKEYLEEFLKNLRKVRKSNDCVYGWFNRDKRKTDTGCG